MFHILRWTQGIDLKVGNKQALLDDKGWSVHILITSLRGSGASPKQHTIMFLSIAPAVLT